MFVFSPYWSVWSRLLLNSTARGYREYLEMNLTSATQAGWNRIPDRILVLHSTTIQPERIRHHLPSEVMGQMRHYLGYPQMRHLLYDDVLAQIDLEKLYAKMRGGGIPLDSVRKT